MAYQIIENFKYGLDSRRSQLTSQAGTLITLNNAHVNQGGEIEKRKAFVRYALPTGTFGIESFTDGLATFGYAAAPAEFDQTETDGRKFLLIGSTKVYYYRLRHPRHLSPYSDASDTAISFIQCTTPYGGYPFVIVKFSDNQVFAYWCSPTLVDSGYVVLEWTLGKVFGGATTKLGLLKNIVEGINSIEGFGAEVVGTTYAQAWGPSGSITSEFTAETPTTAQSAAGRIIVRNADTTPIAEVTGVAAYTDFVINPLPKTFTLSSITINGVEILGETIVGLDTDILTAPLVAAAINNKFTTPAYNASIVGGGGTVRISATTTGVCTFAVTRTQFGGFLSSYDATMGHGVDAVVGKSTYWTFTPNNSWQLGDEYNLAIIYNTSPATIYDIGGGNVGKELLPTYALPYGQRVYLAAGPTLYISSLLDVEGWEDRDSNAGYITPSDNYGESNNLVSLARYQGKLALLTRRSIQIWNVGAAIETDFSLSQTLDNIGTYAPNSVASLGELDILFLYDSGIRSLRVRDSSNNAFVVDIGSPIDSIIQAHLQVASINASGACSVVEPATNHYWMFLGTSDATTATNKIYVLSYYPTSKIIAWSTYDPSYYSGATLTRFLPSKFVVYNGIVYARGSNSAGDAIFVFGGTDGNTYDATVATAQLPWLDAGKSGTFKQSRGIDVAITGAWKISAGMDPNTGTMREVYDASSSSFLIGGIPYTSRGTHFGLKAETTGSAAAKISSFVFHYNLENEK